MSPRRRTLIQAAARRSAAVLGTGLAAAIAQARTKLKVGYLHTPAVDGQIFIGQQMGSFAKRGWTWN
jgi:NitT/TauT family transport system substrate-binding protein